MARIRDTVDARIPKPRDKFTSQVIAAYARGLVDAFAELCRDKVLARLADPNTLEASTPQQGEALRRFRTAGYQDMKAAMDRPSELPQFPTLVLWLESRRGISH